MRSLFKSFILLFFCALLIVVGESYKKTRLTIKKEMKNRKILISYTHTVTTKKAVLLNNIIRLNVSDSRASSFSSPNKNKNENIKS